MQANIHTHPPAKSAKAERNPSTDSAEIRHVFAQNRTHCSGASANIVVCDDKICASLQNSCTKRARACASSKMSGAIRLRRVTSTSVNDPSTFFFLNKRSRTSTKNCAESGLSPAAYGTCKRSAASCKDASEDRLDHFFEARRRALVVTRNNYCLRNGWVCVCPYIVNNIHYLIILS